MEVHRFALDQSRDIVRPLRTSPVVARTVSGESDQQRFRCEAAARDAETLTVVRHIRGLKLEPGTVVPFPKRPVQIEVRPLLAIADLVPPHAKDRGCGRAPSVPGAPSRIFQDSLPTAAHAAIDHEIDVAAPARARVAAQPCLKRQSFVRCDRHAMLVGEHQQIPEDARLMKRVCESRARSDHRTCSKTIRISSSICSMLSVRRSAWTGTSLANAAHIRKVRSKPI